ncbi:uncharacterized protein LOC119099807 [Pollicipes pollicipes]|uniref:uncharacterized protein LOC119099807 n=1 Tax=Pollicipes pollicipes TaxID=41117 RepID=UPI00188503A5|nr:uncharacterized protein LOC119099807 [Pollicipes pollicipes]
MAATDKPAGFRWMPAALALSFLPVFLHSYVINCRHCFSGGTCFNIDQVVMYNVTKCYRSVCRPSRITGKPPMVQIEDVADCQQCRPSQRQMASAESDPNPILHGWVK